MQEKEFTPLEKNKQYDLYNLKNFEPILIDDFFLKRLGIVNVSDKAKEGLREGSLKFQRLFKNHNLTSSVKYNETRLAENSLEIHNYTGKCPANVVEVNPCNGSCSISCLYCLVSDGDQAKKINVYLDYPELVEKELDKKKNENCFFYLSPKTEAFSEPLLETGISHKILRVFVKHYEKNPNSKVRLFIVSKAGTKHLKFKNNGDSVLDLLGELRGKVQFNGSIGLMPSYLSDILEPNAASLEDRLKAMKMLQERGVYAYSVLVQPIIPCYFNESSLDKLLSNLKETRIINIKPEFLTVNMENLAIISQYINHFDAYFLKSLLALYVSKENSNHIKQRCRIAPDRKFSLEGIKLFHKKSIEKEMVVSVCNWVRSEIGLNKEFGEPSEKMGFKCLGYQEKLFES